jgi:hypothetical protein
MIPGGLEKKASDYENFDEFDDDDDDEDEGFVFDFVDKSKEKYTSLTLSNEINTYNTLNNCENSPQKNNKFQEEEEDWDREEKFIEPLDTNKNKLITKSDIKSSVFYDYKNKFIVDQSEILLKELKNAIASCNLDKVIYFFETNKLDVNCKLSNSNWIPLMYSVSCGNYTITKYLIENGADYNFEDGKF